MKTRYTIAALLLAFSFEAHAAVSYEVSGIITNRTIRDALDIYGGGTTILTPGFLEIGQQVIFRYNGPSSQLNSADFRTGLLMKSPGFAWYQNYYDSKIIIAPEGNNFLTFTEMIMPWMIVNDVYGNISPPNIKTKILLWELEQPYTTIRLEQNILGYLNLDFYIVGQNTGAGISVYFDNVMLNTVSGVPEPESWMLMITGFSFCGGFARFNRKLNQNQAL